MMRASRISDQRAFTIPELLVAAVILIIVSAGSLETFIFATRMNRGNNLRMQALAVLQREVEQFRSFKFTPIAPDARLAGGSYPAYKTGVNAPVAADGRAFDIAVTIDNEPFGDGVLNNNEADTTLSK